MASFFKETIWRGLFVVLVLGGAAVVLHRILQILQKVIAPVERHLPMDPAFPNMWAVVLLVLLVFLAGLALKTPGAPRALETLETKLASHIPLFRIMAGVKGDILDDDSNSSLRPALLEDGDKLIPVFLVEETSDGRAAVFIPESSNPGTGTTAIVRRAGVRLVDVPTKQFLKFVKGWGVGSEQVLRACAPSEKGPRS